ncbi:bifunctional phosphoribosylaminoimidazolecarboxamide formyltransferase/IMP cyclohydrolase [Taibaiella soli]|uniref:Bifunctional purine biosynthesis protein PurH n=1 Tax=Taibaiella soli TaxID=1649169 RepID=A0A2W2AZG4_9BACT|nr:bifunctional phosphoribosylaminoimidazolecarboxamide formyltransferase/IMP cyclohydrolase [Taibaiella soli]PZF73068.1 bifunctional phosphoribosylaminoimidazolecarboxamide formyltransferase/IMP cyclohydrolase PurH [Taibaiella soli]
MNRTIQSALISVFYKDGLEPIVRKLHELNVTIYSTGGTQTFIEQLGIPCRTVESVTSYPSILGGRVKTLHPKVFGGILARRDFEDDQKHVAEYEIPFLDLVIVDLYPFEETLKQTDEEKLIVEKVDIGGPSMIRAAAKNFKDVLVVAAKKEYAALEQLLDEQKGETTIQQRRAYAAKAFEVVAHYDVAISDYFNATSETESFQISATPKQPLRYGENPHQAAAFYGNIDEIFEKLNGKELSYNNLVDVDAAAQIISEFEQPAFAIIKHTNVCGVAERDTVELAWEAALSGDPESAFGGVLATNQTVNAAVAQKISELFFEILIAPAFDEDALQILKGKKNRILLQQKQSFYPNREFKRILNGVLVQEADKTNFAAWKESGARECSAKEKEDLVFANIVCKHLKSNAIALVKDKQLIGKGCGQTSRVDALRQAIEKSKQFNFDLKGAVLASDAFFPFDDCVRMAHKEGITAVIQPGGSVRDNDSIQFAKENGLAMVLTEVRHFKH